MIEWVLSRLVPEDVRGQRNVEFTAELIRMNVKILDQAVDLVADNLRQALAGQISSLGNFHQQDQALVKIPKDAKGNSNKCQII